VRSRSRLRPPLVGNPLLAPRAVKRRILDQCDVPFDKFTRVGRYDAMHAREWLKMPIVDTYEVIDTGNPVQALALALEHKPPRNPA